MSDVIVIDTNDVVAVETPSEIILEVSGPQGPAGANLDWDALPNKPATFPPSTHTHPVSQITNFATEVAAVAPPTTNAGLLTSGTLLDARLSTAVTTSLGKADTASQPGHSHNSADILFASALEITGAGNGDIAINGVYIYGGVYGGKGVYYKDKDTLIYWDTTQWQINQDTDDIYFSTDNTAAPWQVSSWSITPGLTVSRPEVAPPPGNWDRVTGDAWEAVIGVRTNPSERGTASTKNVGTNAGDVAAGDDPRFSDARVPLSHASTHHTGGTDALTPANIGAAPSSHAHAISDVTGLSTALGSKQPSGSYATLVSGTVPASQLPSYVDDVIEVGGVIEPTGTGETGKIYVTTINSKIWRWSGNFWIEISASPGSTDAVPEGATNLYHTTGRASAAAPVQSVAGRTGDVTLAISDVTNLQNSLDGKQASGSYAASSHVHPLATTSAAGFLSSSDHIKLLTIQTGAEVNVNADWTASSGDAQILNKPFVPAASSTTPQPSGPAAVGTATAFARGDHRHAHYTVISDEVSGTTQSTPQIISISQAQLPAKIILSHDESTTWTEIALPYMSDVFQGNFDTEAARSVDPVVVIRNYNMGGGGSVRLRVAVGQGEAVYPASGFDEVVFLTDYVFRWNGRFWDMDLRVPEGDTITVGEVFKPRHSGVLAAFTGKPNTATSPGIQGQLAWGYDDGAERLYICVATNTWRRATIATWS